jgi:hypothetical protein
MSGVSFFRCIAECPFFHPQTVIFEMISSATASRPERNFHAI